MTTLSTERSSGRPCRASALDVLGLERIGELAVARPRLSALLVVIATLASLIVIALQLSFDGNFNRMLEGRSVAYGDFARFEKDFRSFSHDEVVLVRSPALATAAGFERLRELQIELVLDETVAGVLSVFSLARPAPSGKGWAPLVPEEFGDDAALKARMAQLGRDHPALRSVYDLEKGAAILVVMPARDAKTDAGADGAPGFSPAALARLKQAIASALGADMAVSFVGRPAVQRDLVAGIQRDQLTLTAFAVLVCALISYFMFRTVAAALLCTIPPLVALAWYLGLQAAFGYRIDFLTTIIPVLLIVLTFADGLHLFFDWRRRCDAGSMPLAALDQAIAAVGPACVLAHLTTAIAFLGLMVSGNLALIGMALAGIMAVAIGYLAVMVVLPITAYWAVRHDIGLKPLDQPVLVGLSWPGIAMLRYGRRALVPLALAATVALLVAHALAPGQYRMTDYVPYDSPVREGIDQIDRIFGGSAQLFVVVDRAEATGVVSGEEIAQVKRVEQAIDRVIGPDRSISLSAVQHARDAGSLAIDLDEQGVRDHPLLHWIVSADRKRLLISTFVSQTLSAIEMEALMSRLEDALATAAPKARTVMTGAALVHARVVPTLIDNLRHGLLLSILVSVIVIAIAFRSWRLGAACIIPNVLPVLAAQAGALVFWDGIDMTSAVALMIGFGLAVDDSVHLLNHYAADPHRHEDAAGALENALQAVSPALVATTVVLSCGMIATFFSTLPTVALFGGVLITVLVLALVCDILLLPTFALLMEGWRRR